MKTNIWLAALFVALAAQYGAAVAEAQDTLKVNSDTVRLKLENDRVRVLESTLPPGTRERMHSHPQYVVYVIKGGSTRVHFPDGEVSEVELKTGDVIYRDPVTHWAENTGSNEISVIMVELKSSK